jgi:subtilisin family serine protease
MKKILSIFLCTILIVSVLPNISGSSINSRIISNNNSDNNLISDFVPGEIIVKYKNNKSPIIQTKDLNEKYQIRKIENLYQNSMNTPYENIYIFHVSDDFDLFSVIDDYSNHPDILYAEPNYLLYPFFSANNHVNTSIKTKTIESNFIPNDPFFNDQWALHNTGQTGGTPDADIDAVEAWDIENGSSEVSIAVIDSGIDFNHPDLTDIAWVNEDEIPDNGIDDDNNGYIDDVLGYDFTNDNEDRVPWDNTGHGTALSGIIAALTNNDIGISGIAWNCKIMVIKIFNEDGIATVSNIAKGIRYAADNSARVICMALAVMSPSPTLRNAIDYAYDKDVFICCGAGNFDNDHKTYPAAFDNVNAVAGTDHNDSRMEIYHEGNDIWLNSTYGDWVDIAAPGKDIYTTLPTYHVKYMNDIWGFNQDYDLIGGVTSATPIVAGVVALILSKNPSYSPGKATAIIKANSDPYDSEYYLGVGRINAYNSLMELNEEPEKPKTPNGPTSGKINIQYDYSTSSTDVNDEQLFYLFDWDDGNYSEWLGPYNSGETCLVSYNWSLEGNYNIRVICKDIYGLESDWSDPLKVTIPRNKKAISHLLPRLFAHFTNLFPILRILLLRLG